MEELTPIPVYELSELLSALRRYQADSISQLNGKYGAEEAAKIWLSANGPTDTQKFGGDSSQNQQSLWDKFKEELCLFLSGDERYKNDRDDLLSMTNLTPIFFVTSVRSSISATLGNAASHFAPAVAMMLYVIGKVGVNAWCKCK